MRKIVSTMQKRVLVIKDAHMIVRELIHAMKNILNVRIILEMIQLFVRKLNYMMEKNVSLNQIDVEQRIKHVQK